MAFRFSLLRQFVIEQNQDLVDRLDDWLDIPERDLLKLVTIKNVVHQFCINHKGCARLWVGHVCRDIDVDFLIDRQIWSQALTRDLRNESTGLQPFLEKMIFFL